MSERVAPDPTVVKRQNDLFDLYNSWPGDPDDDPEFVDQAREIMGLAPLGDLVEAAAGHDVTPGHDEVHHYWTRGPGLAKWAGSPHPATTLHALLMKHGISSERAWEMANVWHKEVVGIYPGEKKGHNPVGPG